MDVPAHRGIQRFDVTGLLPGQPSREIVLDHGKDRVAALAAGIGIASPAAAIVQPDLHDHQFEMGMIPMHGIAENLCQRQGEQFGGDGFYLGHVPGSSCQFGLTK